MHDDHSIQVHGKLFVPFINAAIIQQRVIEMGVRLGLDYRDKKPVFLGILKGSFIFMADLVRAYEGECETEFVRLSSYQGLSSTGTVQVQMQAGISIEGRHVIVVEDIIDSGTTLHFFMETLRSQQPASIAIAALLFKPEALQHPLKIDYAGFEIPPAFVIGYGLDYDGLARNLGGIYQLVE